MLDVGLDACVSCLCVVGGYQNCVVVLCRCG